MVGGEPSGSLFGGGCYSLLGWALFCVSLLVCFLFLCFLQEWIGLIACTGVCYEAIKQVLGYKSAAAPPLMAGSIVADLWQRGRPVATDLPGNAGRFVGNHDNTLTHRRNLLQ